jgi:hypothetical protein
MMWFVVGSVGIQQQAVLADRVLNINVHSIFAQSLYAAVYFFTDRRCLTTMYTLVLATLLEATELCTVQYCL